MKLLSALSPYIVWIKVAIVVIAFGLGWWIGGTNARLAGRLALETERAAVMQDAQRQVEYWQKRAYDSDEKLAKALAVKPAAPAIDEVVNANPSHCDLPKPVGDRVRQALREANQAAASG